MASSTAARFPKETHGQDHCRLFQLPFELRAIIFELAFTTYTNEDGTIDLYATKPPCRNLVLACQATYGESWALYKKACQAYWGQEFTITIVGNLPSSTWHYCNVSNRNLAHITKLRLVCAPSGISPPAVFVVHLSIEGTRWCARLAMQDFSIFGTRPGRELTDFYRHRCNRWLAHLCGEERDPKLALSLLPSLVWAASRPLLFF